MCTHYPLSFTTSTLITIAAVASSCFAASSIAQHAATTAPAAAPTTQPAELPDLKPIQAQVEEIRGLKFKKDVPAEAQSLEDFDTYVSAQLDLAFPPEKRDHMMAALVRLGLLLKPIDLQNEFKNALLSQAGAYYDPQTGTFFYLMADMPKMMLDVTAAHELMHALQDQHFDLGTKMEEWERQAADDVRNDDALLAVRYLVEGEATYIMTLWQMKSMMNMDLAANPAQESAAFRQMANMDVKSLVAMAKMQQMPMLKGKDDPIAKAVAAMDKIPSYIMSPLLAAYFGGANFIMEVRRDGGWDAVAKVWSHPPASSEQCIHPAKYARDVDAPSRVRIPVSTTLGEHWKPVDSAIEGEYLLGVLLMNFGCDKATAEKAVAGWDGDCYRAYQHSDGRVMLALATTWDTEADAREFADAYRAILPRKYPGFAVSAKADANHPTRLSYSCQGDMDHGQVHLRGTEVFIVEGGSINDCDRIMDELLNLAIERVK